jgi:hypothetical protein
MFIASTLHIEIDSENETFTSREIISISLLGNFYDDDVQFVLDQHVE